MYIYYGYVLDHKRSTNREYLEENLSIPDEILDSLSHDADVWYYNGKSTCVAFGVANASCPKHFAVCSGGENFGKLSDQLRNNIVAIQNGGEHPDCPLIYRGAN